MRPGHTRTTLPGKAGMSEERDAQLLLVTCVVLAISILSIAEISSTDVFFEEDDPYDHDSADVLLVETRSSFFTTLDARFKNHNFTNETDVEAVIHTLFNETRDVFYTIGAENGEHLYMRLESINETSLDHYQLLVYFSLKQKDEKVAVSSSYWLMRP